MIKILEMDCQILSLNLYIKGMKRRNKIKDEYLKLQQNFGPKWNFLNTNFRVILQKQGENITDTAERPK